MRALHPIIFRSLRSCVSTDWGLTSSAPACCYSATKQSKGVGADTNGATALPVDADRPTRAMPAPTGGTRTGNRVAGPLEPGQAFGSRYHIIRALGIAATLAVYLELDAELCVAFTL